MSKERIQLLRDQEKWKQIVDLFKNKDSNDPWSKTYHGEALLKVGKKLKAETLLTSVLQTTNKEKKENWFILAKANSLLQKYEEAAIWYEKAANNNDRFSNQFSNCL
jgi:tetratricopeptide (TPR) repeat protein